MIIKMNFDEKSQTEIEVDGAKYIVTYGDNWGCYTYSYFKGDKKVGYIDVSIWHNGDSTLEWHQEKVRKLLNGYKTEEVWSHG